MLVLRRSAVVRIASDVPDEWMQDEQTKTSAPFASVDENRQAYVDYLTRRLEAPRRFVEEAIRARA